MIYDGGDGSVSARTGEARTDGGDDSGWDTAAADDAPTYAPRTAFEPKPVPVAVAGPELYDSTPETDAAGNGITVDAPKPPRSTAPAPAGGTVTAVAGGFGTGDAPAAVVAETAAATATAPARAGLDARRIVVALALASAAALLLILALRDDDK